MSLRYALAILVTGFGLATVSAQQPAKPDASVYHLRNAAAADVVQAVTTFATQANLAVTIVAEPASNTVFVAGDPASHKKVIELVTRIDTPPPTVVMQMMIMQVPAGFAEDVGLGEGDTWVLTSREARMLTAAIRREQKDGDIDILSRPQLTVANNQLGIVRVGSDTAGTMCRITPRITPDDRSVLLRLEMGINKPAGTLASDVQSIQTTAVIPNGGTLVARGARTKASDGSTREVFMLTTIERISPQSGP
jgi:type II secretory pathway component GspD/PulD (secretin)